MKKVQIQNKKEEVKIVLLLVVFYCLAVFLKFRYELIL